MTRVGLMISGAARRLGTWQEALTDEGRVILVGLALLAGALWAAGFPSLAIGVPGGVLVLVGLGVNLRDPRAGLVLIPSTAAVIVALILGG